MTIYAELLSEFEAPVLTEASVRIAKTSKWFPAIAEIRAECARIASETARPMLPPDQTILDRHRCRNEEDIAKAKARREESPPQGLSARETREWYEARGIRPWERATKEG